MPSSVGDLTAALETVDYLADPSLSMAAFLALRMGRPLLLEGQNGVGKSTLAIEIARRCAFDKKRQLNRTDLLFAYTVYEPQTPRIVASSIFMVVALAFVTWWERKR